MTREEIYNYLTEVMTEVESIEGTEPEMRLKLLDVAYMVIKKVHDLRDASNNE